MTFSETKCLSISTRSSEAGCALELSRPMLGDRRRRPAHHQLPRRLDRGDDIVKSLLQIGRMTILTPVPESVQRECAQIIRNCSI
jgi:hypothetical protein